MRIPDIREIKNTARQRLADSANANQVLLIYIGISFGFSLISLLVNYFLDHQVNQFGGLGNLGIRSMLSSIGLFLPMVISLVLMCVDLGYLAAMLRAARGQYTSPQTLRLGFDRFWSLIRCQAVQIGILFFYIFGAAYVSSLIFVLFPFSGEAIGMLSAGVPDFSGMAPSEVLPYLASMAPMFLIYFVLLAIFLIPLFYSWRLANYVIIEKPGIGGFAALRMSSQMMRGNRMALFKLDVSLWWYYLLGGLATVLCYGDSLLPLLGISLPIPGEVAYFVFYFLYLAAQFGILWCFRNRVEVTYGLVYDSLCPKKEETGVVLGNIFEI